MQNKLSDLHNHLFEEIERLGDEDLQGEKLIEEIERAKAITGIAAQIIANGTLLLKAKNASENLGQENLPRMLTE